jgi:peptide deformylase
MKGVVMFPDKVLRKKIEPVKKIDKKTLREIEELKKILQESENGAGLAAPQIGVNKSFFGIKEKGGVRMLINPKLIAVYGEKVYPKMVDNEGKESDFLEGCLSFPDLFGTVKRYLKIEAEWEEVKNSKLESRNKTMVGFEAILWQHEYDHLLGILFVDHIKEDGGKLYLWKGEEKKKISIDEVLKKEK